MIEWIDLFLQFLHLQLPSAPSCLGDEPEELEYPFRKEEERNGEGERKEWKERGREGRRQMRKVIEGNEMGKQERTDWCVGQPGQELQLSLRLTDISKHASSSASLSVFCRPLRLSTSLSIALSFSAVSTSSSLLTIFLPPH